MWRSWYLYIYAFRFLENGYMNPTSIGATWVSNFWRPTTPSPNSLTPRIVVKGAIFLSKFRFFKKACDLWSSDKPKVDLRTKSPRFKHGNHFFTEQHSFLPSEFLDSVWFFGPYSLTHQILPERKPKTFHKLPQTWCWKGFDLWQKSTYDKTSKFSQKPWLKTFCLSKSPISYGLWAWFFVLAGTTMGSERPISWTHKWGRSFQVFNPILVVNDFDRARNYSGEPSSNVPQVVATRVLNHPMFAANLFDPCPFGTVSK